MMIQAANWMLNQSREREGEREREKDYLERVEHVEDDDIGRELEAELRQGAAYTAPDIKVVSEIKQLSSGLQCVHRTEWG